jgi:hypothetical protein
MKPETSLQLPNLPSKRKLAKTTALALAVAVVLLVTTVLPAEYGIDPLGTGAALGLTAISGRVSASTPEEVVVSAGATLTPVQEGPVARYGAEYKVDSSQFVLGPYEYVEYKYHLEKGATMLYSWTATSTTIQDFHGDPDSAPHGSTVSYGKQNQRQANGTFTAPFSGIHGWYWENPGGEPITVTVTTAGFYSSALEFRFDRTRHPHELKALETIKAPQRAEPTAAERK